MVDGRVLDDIGARQPSWIYHVMTMGGVDHLVCAVSDLREACQEFSLRLGVQICGRFIEKKDRGSGRRSLECCEEEKREKPSKAEDRSLIAYLDSPSET